MEKRMDKHKRIFRKRYIGSVLIIICLFLQTTFASEIYQQDTDDKSFYASDQDKIEKIFQTDISDVFNPFEWLMDKKTFVVFKDTKDKNGKKFIKGYYNAPSPQTYINNLAFADISDGYTNETYDVNETQWLVKVGKEAKAENIYTKYGFHIPSFAYMGEYPRIRMDFTEIAPSGFFSSLWGGIKSIFGGSFVNAPKNEEYKSLLYYNHGYLDNDQEILDFFKSYYIPYFVNQINKSKFKSPKDFIDKSFSPELVSNAASSIEDIDSQIESTEEQREEYIEKISDEDAFEYPEVQSAFKDFLKEKNFGGKPTYKNYKKLKSEKFNFQFTPSDHITSDEYTSRINALKEEKAGKEKISKDAGDYIGRVVADAKDAVEKGKIPYSQCLISSDEDEACTSSKYGKPTQMAVMNVYAHSGLYKLTEKKKELTDDDAREILQHVQTYAGPYYQEVANTMILLMQTTAKNQGKDIKLKTQTDIREMPYDIAQMTEEDRATFSIKDPRVEKFRSHVIGAALADFDIDLGKDKLIYFMPQRIILDYSGTFCELAVFFQQLCNFEILESAGLSPTKLWQSGIVTIMIMFLLIMFLFKTVTTIINFVKGKNKPLKTILIATLILFLELGFVTMMTTNPEKTWETIKKPIVAAMDFGENAALYTVEDDIKYMYGNDTTDASVIKYIPYLDAWSKFNTGYNIFDVPQKINKENDTQELTAYEDVKIGDKAIQHYSVLLADAFSYYGQSTSIKHSIKEDDKLYNGKVVNSNAYRVVDHFLAPKITKKVIDKETMKSKDLKADEGIEVKVQQNPNYNGEYQTGFVTLLTKLLINIFNFWTTFVKFCIFIWFWYKLYTFVVSLMLDRSKGWGTLLSTTFTPLLGMIILSYLSTTMILLLMKMQGIVSLIVVILSFVIYNKLLKIWEEQYEATFPKTLLPILFIINIKEKLRAAKNRISQDNYRRDMRNENFDATDEELNDLDKMYEKLYNEDGKKRYSNEALYKPYVEQLKQRQKDGKELTINQQNAIKQQDDKIKKE